MLLMCGERERERERDETLQIHWQSLGRHILPKYEMVCNGL